MKEKFQRGAKCFGHLKLFAIRKIIAFVFNKPAKR